MSKSIQTYQIELTVNGPVFVGSGYEIQKKEYIFLNKSTLGVIDVGKLYGMAKKRHLATDLERFMVIDGKEDLKHWALRNHIPIAEMSDYMKYVVDVGDVDQQRGRMQIMACCADPYGMPYIPGSSVKGMLRTILLCAEVLSHRERYGKHAVNMKRELQEENVKRTKVLRKSTQLIENTAFHTLNKTENWKDAVNDWMSGVIVSDSEPLRREDIILCQKWEKRVNGTFGKLNVLWECVKPGTKIRCSLTIDREKCRLLPGDIMAAAKLVYECYYCSFQSKFAGEKRSSEYTVFLGGGSGFVSKTLIYALFGKEEGIEITKKIFEKTKVPKQHGHREDTVMGVSPHILKCTKYRGQEYMMGACTLKIR